MHDTTADEREPLQWSFTQDKCHDSPVIRARKYAIKAAFLSADQTITLSPCCHLQQRLLNR